MRHHYGIFKPTRTRHHLQNQFLAFSLFLPQACSTPLNYVNTKHRRASHNKNSTIQLSFFKPKIDFMLVTHHSTRHSILFVPRDF